MATARNCQGHFPVEGPAPELAQATTHSVSPIVCRPGKFAARIFPRFACTGLGRYRRISSSSALTVAEAVRRGRALEAEGIAWLEEPIRHDDYAGSAAVARALGVPVQIGENFNGPEAMVEALAAGACDYVMPDVARIGGVSGWLQAAGIEVVVPASAGGAPWQLPQRTWVPSTAVQIGAGVAPPERVAPWQ